MACHLQHCHGVPSEWEMNMRKFPANIRRVYNEFTPGLCRVYTHLPHFPHVVAGIWLIFVGPILWAIRVGGESEQLEDLALARRELGVQDFLPAVGQAQHVTLDRLEGIDHFAGRRPPTFAILAV